MCFLNVDYPSASEEEDIVKRTVVSELPKIKAVTDISEMLEVMYFLSSLPVADNVVEAAVNITRLTRPFNEDSTHAKYIRWGAGPRASQFLVAAARVWGAFNGKLSPDVEDVYYIAHPVLRHRILTNFTAEAEGITPAHIIDSLIKQSTAK